jgi:hypothetical protein
VSAIGFVNRVVVSIMRSCACDAGVLGGESGKGCSVGAGAGGKNEVRKGSLSPRRGLVL